MLRLLSGKDPRQVPVHLRGTGAVTVRVFANGSVSRLPVVITANTTDEVRPPVSLLQLLAAGCFLANPSCICLHVLSVVYVCVRT